MAAFRNQRKLARLLFGLSGIFAFVCVFQWIEAGELGAKIGRGATKDGSPIRFWTVCSIAALGGAYALWLCITWRQRRIAGTFSEDEPTA